MYIPCNTVNAFLCPSAQYTRSVYASCYLPPFPPTRPRHLNDAHKCVLKSAQTRIVRLFCLVVLDSASYMNNKRCQLIVAPLRDEFCRMIFVSC